MSAYCFRRPFRLRYTDFDFKDELSLTSLLGIIQESATGSADELGFGYAEPSRHGRSRPATSFSSATTASSAKTGSPLPRRRPAGASSILVPSPSSRAKRWGNTGEALGEANTNCPYNPEKSIAVPNWKVPRMQGGKEVYRTVARQSLCDHYLHVNNTRYADLFLDCLPMQALEGRTLQSFHISYAKQAKEGSELTLFAEDRGNELLGEVRMGEEVLTQCRFTFRAR